MPYEPKFDIKDTREVPSIVRAFLLLVGALALVLLFANAMDQDRRAVAMEDCLHERPFSKMDDPTWIDKCINAKLEN